MPKTTKPAATAAPTAPSLLRNRIVSSGEEAPDQLLANPKNWRVHPKEQQQALLGVLETIGWVQEVIVNKTTGHIVDGHLRVMLALRREEATIPVKYVDLTEEEEALVLATIDPIAAMAVTDQSLLRDLMSEVSSEDDRVNTLLGEIATREQLSLPGMDAPEKFETVDENIETEHRCPKCGYEWSGKPAA